MKTIVLAAVLFVCVACGDAPAPDTTQATASPSVAAESPSSAPAQAVVKFLNAPITAKRGTNATLRAKTTANTSCSIEVDYKSGPSSAAGLIDKTSNATGSVSWTWKVGANTTRGAWPITVTCGDASAQTHINVV